MLLLLLLVTYDSLPPLPDLSRISFPEPALWVLTPANEIYLYGHTGQCTQLHGRVTYGNASIRGSYTDHLNWGNVHYSEGTVLYTIGLPHLFLKPLVNGTYLKHEDEYLRITPGLEFASSNPWSIVQGYVAYSFWRINSRQKIEAQTMLDIIFDRTQYKPQLFLPGVYMNDQYTQLCGIAFHIHHFHISTVSPVNEYFPSPLFKIEYLHPSYTVASEVMSGVDLLTLKDRFDPALPLQYYTTFPVESLRVAVHLSASLIIHDQQLEVSGAYRDWYNLMIPADDFALAETLDVQELTSEVVLKNRIPLGDLMLTHVAHGSYVWGENAIPLRPRYAVYDTLTMDISWLTAGVAIEHRSALKGITSDFTSLTLIHPMIGVRYRTVALFGIVMNSTGLMGDYYDGFPIPPRAFAGGIRFHTTF